MLSGVVIALIDRLTNKAADAVPAGALTGIWGGLLAVVLLVLRSSWALLPALGVYYLLRKQQARHGELLAALDSALASVNKRHTEFLERHEGMRGRLDVYTARFDGILQDLEQIKVRMRHDRDFLDPASTKDFAQLMLGLEAFDRARALAALVKLGSDGEWRDPPLDPLNALGFGQLKGVIELTDSGGKRRWRVRPENAWRPVM